MTARWLLLLLPLLAACSSPEERTFTERWPDGNVKREVVVLAEDTTEIAVYDKAGRLSKISRWADGQQHGKWEAFYPDGKPWSVHQYHHGVQVGGLFYVVSQRKALHHRAIRFHWQPHRHVAFLQ